jgi:hypothetical protein
VARAGISVDQAKLRGVVNTSSEMNELLRNNAREITIKARAIFVSRNRKDNEWRTSETTPPKYVNSFAIERLNKGDTFSWIAKNTDPAAAWVELGAHAGGRTFVLRYYPLKLAVQAQGATN